MDNIQNSLKQLCYDTHIMAKVNIRALILIVILVGGFAIIDYHYPFLQPPQDLKATIGDATAIATPAITIPATLLSPPASASSAAAPAPVCILNQYKLLENVDECNLNTYGKKGWSIFQAGSVAEQGGRGTDCRSISQFNLDWVVLQKGSASHTCF